MARPANVQSITLSGRLSGAETFATTVWTANGDPSNYTVGSAAQLVAAASFQSMITVWKSLLNTGSAYQTLTLRAYGAPGQGSQLTSTAPINGAVGTGDTPVPNQICRVASLYTATANRRGRGRMYFPSNGVGVVANDGRLALGTNFIDTLAAWLGVIDAVVVSESDSVARPVTSLRIGDVPDTQRRRRDGMVEQYQQKAVV